MDPESKEIYCCLRLGDLEVSADINVFLQPDATKVRAATELLQHMCGMCWLLNFYDREIYLVFLYFPV